jgi:hypothetical protein
MGVSSVAAGAHYAKAHDNPLYSTSGCNYSNQ